MAKSFIGVPSIYSKLLELRKSKTAKFKQNEFLKETTVLRYYQVVGSLHMMLLERMILGDSCGLGKCVSSDTYIPTSYGMMQISDLAQPDMKEDTFCGLPEDFFLLSKEGIVKPSMLYCSGDHYGIKITTRFGYEITGLYHHPLLCSVDGEICYRRIDQLRIGHVVLINCKRGFFSDNVKNSLDEDLAESIGSYIVRGKVKDSIREIFELSNLKSLGINPDWEEKDKEVPLGILRSPQNIIRSFLRGFFGEFIEFEGVVCCLESEKLIHQIQLLLLNFGIISDRKGVRGCWQKYWILTLYGKHLIRLEKEIQGQYDDDCNDDFFLDKVAYIEEKEGKFYDFHVPDVHNFVGNGFINHNTLQVIATYTFLLQMNPALKLLVVCPKSATFQWEEEFQKFTNNITTRVIENKCKGFGEGFESRKHQYEEFKENVFIINYDPVLYEYDSIKEVLSPHYMAIFDECTSFKNRKTKTHLACKYIAEGSQRVYGLSATIIKNGLEEVWGIYNVVVPGLFGNITNFKKKFCNQELMKLRIKGKSRYIPKITGYKNLKEFKQVLDPYLLIRRKEEVASELPKLISKKIILEMLPDQKRLYREALSGIFYEERIKHEYFELSDQIRNGISDKAIMKRHDELQEKYNAFLSPEGKKRGKLAALTYCQMISNGPYLVKEQGESSKEVEFLRLMQEELLMEKVILFTRFKSGIPVLEMICERNHIKYTKIHGDLNDKERQRARLMFQDDPTCNLIFITSAGSEALNLQAASVLIFYDTPWSYGALVQTIGRAQRIGSIQKYILVTHLVNKKTIDMRVIDKVSGKKNLSDEILGDTAEGALDFISHEDTVIDELFEDLLKDAKELG